MPQHQHHLPMIFPANHLLFASHASFWHSCPNYEAVILPLIRTATAAHAKTYCFPAHAKTNLAAHAKTYLQTQQVATKPSIHDDSPGESVVAERWGGRCWQRNNAEAKRERVQPARKFLAGRVE
jgi:hypothetical protein